MVIFFFFSSHTLFIGSYVPSTFSVFGSQAVEKNHNLKPMNISNYITYSNPVNWIIIKYPSDWPIEDNSTLLNSFSSHGNQVVAFFTPPHVSFFPAIIFTIVIVKISLVRTSSLSSNILLYKASGLFSLLTTTAVFFCSHTRVCFSTYLLMA
jgi:hypothetical protein